MYLFLTELRQADSHLTTGRCFLPALRCANVRIRAQKNVSAIKSAATLSWSNMTLSEHHCTERNMGRTFEAETCVLAAAS